MIKVEQIKTTVFLLNMILRLFPLKVLTIITYCICTLTTNVCTRTACSIFLWGNHVNVLKWSAEHLYEYYTVHTSGMRCHLCQDIRAT